VLPSEIAEQNTFRRFMKELNLRSLKHELRTPVNHILGYSELLLESAQDAGDDTLMTQARGIHSNGRKLVELIDHNLASDEHMETARMGELWAGFHVILDQIMKASTPNSTSHWLGSYTGDLEKIRRAATQLTEFLQDLDTSSHAS